MATIKSRFITIITKFTDHSLTEVEITTSRSAYIHVIADAPDVCFLPSLACSLGRLNLGRVGLIQPWVNRGREL